MNKKIAAAVIVLAAAAAFLFFRYQHEKNKPAPDANVAQDVPLTPVPAASLVPPEPVKPPVQKKPAAPAPTAPRTPPVIAPPPSVTLHTELIPKDIQIVRVYYANQLTGPGTEIEFDINGSGFNKEFEKMITVESGSPDVSVKNLALVTLNQIHGTLVVAPKTVTGVSFPQVLIQNKVVFRAAEPFAVIRPGDVLNVILTQMGENGRTGRIRVYTNLTSDMFSLLKIETSTPSIRVIDVQPTLPYIVDATIDTDFHPGGGDYDLIVKLGAVTVFERKGFVRIVRPNVGQTGLAQQVRAVDGFHRPGDRAQFVVMGSGFLPDDANHIVVRVAGFSSVTSSFTYVRPGRLELAVTIPANAKPGVYPMELLDGSTSLLNVPNLFQVVDKNWTRALEMSPALVSGGKSTLALTGRDLAKDFIERIKTETDEPGLHVGPFHWVGVDRAEAPIEALPSVAPGDYLLKMTQGGQAVDPAMGSIVRVEKGAPK